jgi:catechol 2,3-dioxygenase-like lactoylglutathione lyase family enzyme
MDADDRADSRADDRDVLAGARVATRLPAQDLDRARRFYSEKLGLEPVDERPGGLLYRCGGADFVLFRSTGASPGTFTQMALEVGDIEAAVAELKRRGVVFEEVDVRAGSPRSRGTTRARAPGANAAPGSTTARGTCWGSGSRSTETRLRAARLADADPQVRGKPAANQRAGLLRHPQAQLGSRMPIPGSKGNPLPISEPVY